MVARKVASLFACKEDAALSRILLDAGWQSEMHESGFGDCRAGIACLSTADGTWLDRIQISIASHRRIPWIAIVGPGLIERDPVREFIVSHCIDYQTKPVDHHRLLTALGHAVGMATLLAPDRGSIDGAAPESMLIGHSRAMQSLRRDLVKIAAVDAPALITGETGTGKELVGRTIHILSPRHVNPFIAINCAALPPSLIHAELFGFEKGAFTGAHRRQEGHFEAAQGGTIFLDEVGDLHADLQALLLRFLEQRTIRRVGGREEIQIDARVLAATNVDLESAVREGKFREDLYYRLNVLRINTPPLREHGEDIGALAAAFLTRYQYESPMARGFSRAALHALQAHRWPGNVRELVSCIRRAIVMCDGPLITPRDLCLAEAPREQPMLSLDAARLQAEKNTVLAALQRTGGNARQSAELIGVSRATFYRLLCRHGLAAENSDSIKLPAALIAELLDAPHDSTGSLH
ncbi:MAG TPA: sigma-54 dependent transcriptional regulator [Steroidobacter sp.]|uniref:sigma-54 dependent transcriptional regulator n=1 Tax=Steroidobacter sp. TaxID=1978227 RepID=UPI002EDA0755